MNVHQLSSTHRDDPFMVRLQRFMDIGSAAFTDLRKALGAEIAIKKKRDLVTDGYACSKLSFIRDGFAVRYKLLNSGKRQIVSILLPGDVIGLPGSFLDRATFSVIALTNMRLHACSLDSYVALCYRRPEFGLVLSWLAVQEATTYAERIIDIGRRTSQERLARFLLEIHSRLAAIGRATKAAFELPFSQEVISDALGLSVPHLNRTFAQLRSEGLVALHERQVTFRDLQAVQHLAQFQPSSVTRIPDTGIEDYGARLHPATRRVGE